MEVDDGIFHLGQLNFFPPSKFVLKKKKALRVKGQNYSHFFHSFLLIIRE